MMRFLVCLMIATAAASCSTGFGDNGGYLDIDDLDDDDCGDGIRDPGEGCDDGNHTSGDGCTASCAIETANPMCGNGVRETNEGCDDGNTLAGDGCSPACTVESVQSACGNGIKETGEGCDDNNTTPGDGCSAACEIETAAACGLVPQTGCAMTEACDLTATDTTECRPITTAGTSDDTCASQTQCARGYTCVSNPGADASCMRFCEDDSDCAGSARCVYSLQSSDGDALDAKVCSNSCSLLNQSGCPTGTGCTAVNNSSGDYTDCQVMGSTLDGSPCSSSSQCQNGSMCYSGATGSTCERYCDVVNAAATCTVSEQCMALTDPLNINGVQYGACVN